MEDVRCREVSLYVLPYCRNFFAFTFVLLFIFILFCHTSKTCYNASRISTHYKEARLERIMVKSFEIEVIQNAWFFIYRKQLKSYNSFMIFSPKSIQ